MSTSSHFSDETELAGNAQNEWEWMNNEYLAAQQQTRSTKWWKRPLIFYSALFLIVAAMVALAATGIVLGLDDLSGWRPIRGNSPPDVSTTNNGDEQGASLPTQPPSPQTAYPTTLPTLQPTRGPRTVPLAFYVMGDVPYSKWEEQILISQIQNLTAHRHPGAAFLVHCGDMMKAQRTGCAQGYYQNVRNILSQGPLPTFVLCGDNDHVDCEAPDIAWEYYLDSFVDFEQDWLYRLPDGVPPLGVTRWLLPENVPLEDNATRWTTRSEMFSFAEDGILFLSMTLMHVPDGLAPDDLFQERLADSKAWVTQQVNKAVTEHRSRGEQLRGVVLFGHARIAEHLRPFFMELKQVFYDALVYVPVLYIHGDGHVWNVNENFGSSIGWTQFTDVQVDQGAKADPLLIEVAFPPKGGIMQQLISNNRNQYVVGNGLFRIDRQNGEYNNIQDENV